tara:strand:+ start:191 stop:583 length:393 start_codon:yes stop_codon:yes gene_type:complete
MASTVHNGSITPGNNYTYTNNTNKNVRIVINYLWLGQSGSNVWLYIGTGQGQTGDATTIAIECIAGQTYGKHLGYYRQDEYSSEGSTGGASGSHVPLEFFLPEGSHFIIDVLGNHNKKTMYNFVVITEDQ